MHDQSDLDGERNLRILAIDDNEQIHEDYKKILCADASLSRSVKSSRAAFFGEETVGSAPEPFEIDSAYQGRDGFEMVRQTLCDGRPYAMAFVDIRMPPGWDGIETVKHIWAEDQRLQIVICTAHTDYCWEEIVKELGQSDQLLILKKPFDNIEVRQLACSLTKKWRLARQSRLKKDQLEEMVNQRTAALEKSEAQTRAIVESAHDCIISMDHTGTITEFNPAAETTLGYPRSVALGSNVSDLIIPSAGRADHRKGLERYLATGEDRVLDKPIELTALCHDGSEIPVEATINVVRHSDAPPHFTAIMRDIKERKRVEEKLRHDALHDALTALPNRAMFFDRLDNAIQRSLRHADHLFAVLFLDLDRFKNVNDSLGHLAGDKLIVDVANRLQQCVRDPDTVARLGGDEFAVLVDDLTDVNDAIHVVERIDEALSRPFNLYGEEIFTTASIGIALSSTGYDRGEDILRDADSAMYRAKSRGKACYQLFTPEMLTQAKSTLKLENDLRRAMDRREFRVFYQPIVSLVKKKLVGFEALLRWQHPERGLLLPEEFLDVMEESGLMVPIGWWVLGTACRQLRKWQEQFSTAAPLKVNVNLSPRQIKQPDIVESALGIIHSSGIKTEHLCLEITENAVIENTQLAVAALSKLADRGIRLAIDDFGTGYSSLSYLQRFPYSALKIDRSFVNRASEDESEWRIIQTIVDLAHDMGMTVVAEGVETREQLTRLKALGCDYGQGYFFAKPMDHDAVQEWLADENKSVHVEPATIVAAAAPHS